jgi:hypothetical protein
MAEDRTVAVGEHRGHPQRPLAEAKMADRVDAGMDSPQPASLQPMRNRSSPEAKRCQLPPRDHSMLPRRKLRKLKLTFPSSCTHGLT